MYSEGDLLFADGSFCKSRPVMQSLGNVGLDASQQYHTIRLVLYVDWLPIATHTIRVIKGQVPLNLSRSDS